VLPFIDARNVRSSFGLVAESEGKTTPLIEEHRRAGAKIIPFGGWLMPVQYTSISDEHQAVRKNVGVFDISHMGQFIASGARAGEWLNRMLTNNVEKLDVRSGQYTFLLNQNGGIIDDLIVYRVAAERYLLVVNASRTEEDFGWLQAHILPEVKLENRSDSYAGLAIQGPRVGELFKLLLGEGFALPARNTIAETELGVMPLAIARTGYTGEDGVEVFFEAKYAPAFWTSVLEKGQDLGIRPCGLGARDTLRLEMCYPLNGNDLTPEHTPLEAGLGFFVDLAKPNFTGREVLLKQKEDGLKRRLAPFKMKAKGPPPRPHYAVYRGDERLGEVNSGTLSPSLGEGIGMAYLPAEHAKVGTELEVEIRGQKFPAVIEKKPLYKKSS
jgi:aminomethyltransferase